MRSEAVWHQDGEPGQLHKHGTLTMDIKEYHRAQSANHQPGLLQEQEGRHLPGCHLVTGQGTQMACRQVEGHP